MQFTDPFLRNTKSPITGRAEYADSLVPGLRYRVTAQGARSFSVYYRYGGKQRRVTLGKYPTVSLSSARSAARELLQQVALGVDPCAPAIAPLDTIEALLDAHLRDMARRVRA